MTEHRLLRGAAVLWLLIAATLAPGARHLKVDFDLAALYASFTGEVRPETTAALLVVPGDTDTRATVARLEKIPGVVTVRAPRVEQALLHTVPHNQHQEALHAMKGKPQSDVLPISLTLDARDPPLDAIQDLGVGDLVGLPVMNRAHAESSRAEQLWLGGAVVFALLGALGTLLARLRDAVLVMFSVATGIAALLGLMGWLGQALGGPNLMLAPLITVLGIADSLHLLRSYAHTTGEHRIRDALREVFGPCLLTSLTTALAFLALLSSSSAPIRVFGMLAALGMLLALVSGLLVPAAVLSFSPTPGARPGIDRWIDRLSARARGTPAWLGLSLLVFAGLATQVQPDLQLGGELTDDHPALLAQHRVDKALGGVFPLALELETGTPDGTAEPDAAARLVQLHRTLERHHAIGAVISYADVLRWAAGSKGRRAEQLVGAVGSKSTTRHRRFAKFHDQALANGVDQLPLPLFDEDRSAFRVYARFRDVGARAWEPPIRHLEGYAKLNAGLEVKMQGYVPLAVATVRQIPKETLRVVGLTLLSALLVVGLAHRRVRPTLLVVPILGGTLLSALGTMGAIGLPLNHTSLFVLSLAVGLGVDPWLHLQAQGARAAPAIVWTTGVLCVGFASLQLSTFSSVRGIGLVLGVSTVVNGLLALALHRLTEPVAARGSDGEESLW